MIEEKGLGGKRVNPMKLSLTNKEESDLRKLATACGKAPAVMAREILAMCMYDSDFVAKLQHEFCKEKAYRVMLVQDIQGNKPIQYKLLGRDDL